MTTKLSRLALAVGVALSGASASAQKPDPAARPNVLFLCIDDLADWVGCLGGHPDARTPHLDALAARGVLFTNAHCVSPICGPSRAAVLTGMRPETTGAYTNRGTWIDYVPKAVSLPRCLKLHGYRVLGAGKVDHGLGQRISADWHSYGPGCGVVGTPFTNRELRAEGMLPSREIRRRGRLVCTLPMNGGLSMEDRPGMEWDTFDWGPVDLPEAVFPDAKIAAWAVGKLGRGLDVPFFLAVGFYKPHQPFFLPRAHYERFNPNTVRLPATVHGDLLDVPVPGCDLALRPWTSGTHATVIRADRWREAVAAYLATISFVDDQVGKVLDALARSEHADRTWIIAWSDHGWSLGEKQHWGKHDPWQSSVRVPLIVVPPRGLAPKGFRRGSRSKAPVSLLDLYPTVLDLCGLPAREELEGKSLLPLIANPEAPFREAVVATVGRGTHSVFAPGWRYIRYFDGSEELYDLSRDPEEWFNLARHAKFAATKQRLAAAIPEDPGVERYVRWGRYKCVFHRNGKAELYDLHAPLGISEQDDVAGEHARVVSTIRKLLEERSLEARRLRLPTPEETRDGR